MGNSGGKLIIYVMVVFLLLLALVKIFINSSGKFFNLELLGFIVLSLLSLIGFIGYSKAWGERVLFFVFIFYITNLLLLWYYKQSLFMVPLFLAVLGFLLSVPKNDKSDISLEETHFNDGVGPDLNNIDNEMPDPGLVLDKPDQKSIKKNTLSKADKNSTKFSPGKYIASKRGKYFHEPKSEWAKKINKSNQVWFKSKQEALRKGYKAHQDVN